MDEEQKVVDPAQVDPPPEPVVDPVPAVEPSVDLEADRDARVAPVAQGVLEDIATETTIASADNKTDFTGIISKLVNRTLDADLNLTTENPYIFQLVLGTYGALSNVIQSSKMVAIDDLRFSRIGAQILTLLANAKVPMGTKVKTEDQIAALQAIVPDLEAIWAAENLTWLEIKHILEGVFRSLKALESNFSTNIDAAVKIMECKILGIADMSDLTMKKLDETLRADTTVVK